MRKVERLGEFPVGSYINGFLGKDVDEAIKEAEKWQAKTGIVCHMYYVQMKLRTSKWESILVSYDRVEKENEQ